MSNYPRCAGSKLPALPSRRGREWEGVCPTCGGEFQLVLPAGRVRSHRAPHEELPLQPDVVAVRITVQITLERDALLAIAHHQKQDEMPSRQQVEEFLGRTLCHAVENLIAEHERSIEKAR